MFRFVGTLLRVGERTYYRFGDCVDIPDGQVDTAVYMRGGATVVTEEQFQSIGFTDAELQKFRTPASQFQAGSDFVSKLERVRSMVGVRPVVKESK